MYLTFDNSLGPFCKGKISQLIQRERQKEEEQERKRKIKRLSQSLDIFEIFINAISNLLKIICELVKLDSIELRRDFLIIERRHTEVTLPNTIASYYQRCIKKKSKAFKVLSAKRSAGIVHSHVQNEVCYNTCCTKCLECKLVYSWINIAHSCTRARQTASSKWIENENESSLVFNPFTYLLKHPFPLVLSSRI